MATIQQSSKQQNIKPTGVAVVVISLIILISIAMTNSSSVVSGIIVACLIFGLGVTAFLSIFSRDNSRYEVKD